MAIIKHSLFQRAGSRRWILTVSVDAGPWRQLTLPPEIKGKVAARAWADDRIASIESGAPIQPAKLRAGDISVSDLVDRAIALREGYTRERPPRLRVSTVKNDRSNAKRLVAAIGERSASDITKADARAFLRDLRAELSANSVRHLHSTAKTLWDVALGEEWIRGANPWRDKHTLDEVPKARTVAGKVVVFTRETVQALIEAEALPVIRRMRYLVAASTGLNDGEIAGLRWRDVVLDAPVPYLSVVSSIALRGPTGFATESALKTENRERRVPLNEPMRDALAWWKAEGWPFRTGAMPRGTDFVFTKTDRRSWRPKSAEYLKRDLEAAGLPTSDANGNAFTFQAFRRTFSTALLRAGVHQEIRGALMGHAGKTVTAAHYTDFDDETVLRSLAEAVEKLPYAWPIVVSGNVRTRLSRVSRDSAKARTEGKNEMIGEVAIGEGDRLAERTTLCTLAVQHGRNPTTTEGAGAKGNRQGRGDRHGSTTDHVGRTMLRLPADWQEAVASALLGEAGRARVESWMRAKACAAGGAS